MLKMSNPEEMKDKLNAVGPIRLAKWTQLTLNLQNGTAHSCSSSYIGIIDEIKLDPNRYISNI